MVAGIVVGATFGCCVLCLFVFFLSCWCCPKLRKYRDVLERQVAAREKARDEELKSLAAEEAELEADEKAFEIELAERTKQQQQQRQQQQQPAGSSKKFQGLAAMDRALASQLSPPLVPSSKWADYYHQSIGSGGAKRAPVPTTTSTR